MTCPYTENISSLIDGELSSPEVRVLERHINECEECQLARSDFLNLRSQIVDFSPAVDQPASRQALAKVLAKIQTPNALPRRSGSPGLFGALRFKPVFATVALLIIGFFGVLIYRNNSRQISTNHQTRANGRISDQSQGAPAAKPAPKDSPTPSTANTDEAGKSNESKKPQQRSRPPVEVPKIRKGPSDLISPWSNQAIAAKKPTAEVLPDAVVVGGHDAQATSLTARHLGQSELLLRSFRNVRTAGSELAEVGYERRSAQKLVYQNILLRREADAKGDVQVATLLDSLEPILLDIANLPERARDDDVRAIKERLQRKNLVALLQVNSTVLARAND